MILLKDDGAGQEVVQKDLQGSGEVDLILQVTWSGGDGLGLDGVQATAVELEKMVVLVGREVVVMEDWEEVMLVIWVGGRALDSPVESNSSSST